MIEAPKTGKLFRGAYELPHQAQMIRRDLHGEKILAHAGQEAMGYRLTAEQKASGRWHYEYLVYAPGHPAFSWTAFHTMTALIEFSLAYDIRLDHLPKPGERFTATLPADDTCWQPLEARE